MAIWICLPCSKIGVFCSVTVQFRIISSSCLLWELFCESTVVQKMLHSFLCYILYSPSNGLLDPWSSGGVLKNGPKGSEILAITIPEAAHHLDLRESNPSDPASVIQARKIHTQYIKKWIKAARSRP